MNKHTYLTNNGLPTIDASRMLEGKDSLKHPIRTFNRWKRIFSYRRIERKKGFNPANTWCLESYFFLSLYEMIEAYLDNADGVVDLNYHAFEYKDEQYTQKELLEIIKKEIKDLFEGKHPLIDNWDKADKAQILKEKQKKILDIWYIVLPAMWW